MHICFCFLRPALIDKITAVCIVEGKGQLRFFSYVFVSGEPLMK